MKRSLQSRFVLSVGRMHSGLSLNWRFRLSLSLSCLFFPLDWTNLPFYIRSSHPFIQQFSLIHEDELIFFYFHSSIRRMSKALSKAKPLYTMKLWLLYSSKICTTDSFDRKIFLQYLWPFFSLYSILYFTRQANRIGGWWAVGA